MPYEEVAVGREEDSVLSICTVHRLMLATDGDPAQLEADMEPSTVAISIEGPMKAETDFSLTNDVHMAFIPPCIVCSFFLNKNAIA